jgi:hypothetical protein
MINVIENKDYRNLQNDYYDGESFVYFDIIQIDAENDNITVMVSHQGKLAMRTFELMVDEDNDVFFEYGPCFEKIYLEQFI